MEPIDTDPQSWPQATAPGGTIHYLVTFDLDPANAQGGYFSATNDLGTTNTDIAFPSN